MTQLETRTTCLAECARETTTRLFCLSLTKPDSAGDRAQNAVNWYPVSLSSSAGGRWCRKPPVCQIRGAGSSCDRW